MARHRKTQWLAYKVKFQAFMNHLPFYLYK
jgi:hypothetical protein